jgi:hypothetical protein
MPRKTPFSRWREKVPHLHALRGREKFQKRL